LALPMVVDIFTAICHFGTEQVVHCYG
jgi:hypothetical protein